MPLAPILLLTYNRLDHTQMTIEALKENVLAAESDLYVYADAAKNTESEPKVNAVRAYLTTISGFKSVHVRLREKNLGVDDNTILAVTEVVNERGRVIVLEDDLVTSPWFLTYMNDALDHYEHDEHVISVHGYRYPVRQPLKTAFFLKGADCWGWATWKRGWDLFEHDGKKLLDQLTARGLQREFNFNDTHPYVDALENQAAGKTKHWDIRWYASAFLAGKLTLYPGESLVKNIGHDASGTHCGVSQVYDVVLAASPVNVKTEIKADPEAFSAFADFFRNELATGGRKKNWLSRSFRKLKTLRG